MLLLLLVGSTLSMVDSAANVPSVSLHNAANAGLTMPAIGLGTGAYGQNASVGFGGYPECWAEFPAQMHGAGACGVYVRQAVDDWLSLGGRRIDSANSYSNQLQVGRALHASAVPVEEMFVLSKVGSTNPMGYNDTLTQAKEVLADLGLERVDMLLVHWPTALPSVVNGANSTDPVCGVRSDGFTRDAAACRLSTWRAMLRLWREGSARAVGVSNYNTTHLEEIRAAGLPMPAMLQIPFNPALGRAQAPLREYCRAHNITVVAYSPLGTPDVPHSRPGGGNLTLLQQPVVTAIAAAHRRSAAQVLLRWSWQQGVLSNPRSVRPAHMVENLRVFEEGEDGFKLTDAEMERISALPQDLCVDALPSVDYAWYECFPQWMNYPPFHTKPHTVNQ